MDLQQLHHRTHRAWQFLVAYRFGAVLLSGMATLGISNIASASGPVSAKARDVALAGSSRASSSGTDGVFVNPAAMATAPELTTSVQYRIDTATRTHGMAAIVHDSLNNPRLALALTYVFMKGRPQLGYINSTGKNQHLNLSHFGHEAGLHISIAALPKWVYLGTALRYQYASLRYRDKDDKGQEVLPALNAFGLDAGLTFTIGSWVRLAGMGYNLVGAHRPNYSEKHPLVLENVDQAPGTVIDTSKLVPLSDYPLSVAHALAFYPLGRDILSLNFDGLYDFSSYYDSEKEYLRKTYGGSIEFKLGPVPLRAGGQWDSMGPKNDDDRVFVGGGFAYTQRAGPGKPGFDLALGVAQQVKGEHGLSTTVALHLTFELQPQI